MDNQEMCTQKESISENNIEKKEIQILIVGLDDAGKTSLLYKLKLGEDCENIATIGYNVETVEFDNVNFTIWDIGGLSTVRCLWRFYTEQKSVVIFVVDASNPARFEEAKLHLHSVMVHDDLSNTVLLVLANKHDKLKDFNDSQLEESLDLKSIKQTWRICKTCALGDFNLNVILQNLSEMTRNLNIPVIYKEKVIAENIIEKNEEVQILMVGLDEAGKTSLLYKLKLGKDSKVIGTIGYNVETVEFDNVNCTFWDIGGRSNVRCLWRYYTEHKSFVIFVVDASNPLRFEEAKQYLHSVMAHDDLSNTVLLVLANKQDKLEDFNDSDLEEGLDLKSLTQKWRICMTCALGDFNLNVILQNLSEMS